MSVGVPRFSVMSGNRLKRLDSFKCPQCGEKMLKKIVYGMPGDDFDFKNNFVGGCMPGPEDIGCKNCEWVGFRSELEIKHVI